VCCTTLLPFSVNFRPPICYQAICSKTIKVNCPIMVDHLNEGSVKVG
jgi:hypothetical protein